MREIIWDGMNRYMMKNEFEASVGMSREWDARKAGQEVVRETIKNLHSPPNFVLLFSTIHYEKYGGFQEFLNGVWDVLPEETPVVGGTVAGFVNPEGCFTRGATALAVSCPEMKVAIGIGKNTKRNPKKAAKVCSAMIKQGLSETHDLNRFVFSLISSSLVLDLPVIGSKKVISSRILSGLFIPMLPLINKIFQKGVGREDEVFEHMREELQGFSSIFGSSMDGMSFLRNYQFFKDKIFQNSIVSLGFSAPVKITVGSYTGMHETNKKLRVTKKVYNNRVIKNFNNKPATDEYLRAMGCSKDYLTDSRIYDVAPYFPIGFEKNGKVLAEVVPYYLGKSIMTSYKNNYDDLSVLSVTGKKLLNAVEEAFAETSQSQGEKKFSLMVSCATILYTLGNKVYETQKTILEEMKGNPFLLVYTGGEGSFDSNELYVGNETHTQATFLI